MRLPRSLATACTRKRELHHPSNALMAGPVCPKREAHHTTTILPRLLSSAKGRPRGPVYLVLEVVGHGRRGLILRLKTHGEIGGRQACTVAASSTRGLSEAGVGVSAQPLEEAKVWITEGQSADGSRTQPAARSSTKILSWKTQTPTG